jgi:hypothetical protein
LMKRIMWIRRWKSKLKMGMRRMMTSNTMIPWPCLFFLMKLFSVMLPVCSVICAQMWNVFFKITANDTQILLLYQNT